MSGATEFYSYDDGDKLLSAGVKTYTYDGAGRTTSVKVGMGAPLVLTYDDEDRLKTFMGQTYTYNGFDTRVGKNGTTYHRDGTGVTAPLISDSNATYTPGISERRNGVSTFLNLGLKDVAKQTDAAGVVTATRKYDAYGMVIGSTGTWKGPVGYSGSAGYQEDETGLQLLGHRYYDPSIGRFITRDPIKAGRNWYGYCSNNPIDRIDADGLQDGPVPSRDSVTANPRTLKELIEEGVLNGGKEAVKRAIEKILARVGIRISKHALMRALERIQDINDILDIINGGGGFFDPVTDSYIIYSSKHRQGVVIDRKTGEIITILSKGKKSARWIAIGRGAIEAVLKRK